jgi:hypothetical protein
MIAADELQLILDAQPAMPAAARRNFEERIAAYRAQIKLLGHDPSKREGLDELFDRAKSYEAERAIALRKDPYFDWSQALLQIAIVLASVHLILGRSWLMSLSGGMCILSILLMLNAFALAVRLPFLG